MACIAFSCQSSSLAWFCRFPTAPCGPGAAHVLKFNAMTTMHSQTLFELSKEALRQLRDDQLEELVFRLAEAEVKAKGGPISAVRGAGSSDAADGGVDVRVNVPSTTGFQSDFLPCANVIFQVKKHTMPPGKIKAEMCPRGHLRPSIADQANGAYILVSLEDDCSDSMFQSRRKAMEQALADHPNQHAIHLDFYDRSKLHQWLRQHSSVNVWLRNIIGQPLSGWQPYGHWSHPPAHDEEDRLILADGVSVTVPEGREKNLTIEAAIPVVRKLVRETTKAVRVVGLSGVGKTRFVQALFEDTIGSVDPLNRTQVIYGDTGTDLQPSARTMVETLINEQRSAIVVLDNCSAAVHGELAQQVAASPARKLKLITVEYDIREDQPQTTDVVQMTADGTGIAEQLLRRRYPRIGTANASRAAEFAGGNARVALALAEQVEDGESLASLSDNNLLDRLLQQRNQPDGELRRHAEALALVYSYAVETENGIDELAVLGRLIGANQGELFRTTATLLKRGIAQQRGKWRAVLPPAIANRLATSALRAILPDDLIAIFKDCSHRRLCKSFANRLRMLDDQDVVQKIAKPLFQGLQQSISMVHGEDEWILEYIAQVIPEKVLDWINSEISNSVSKNYIR